MCAAQSAQASCAAESERSCRAAPRVCHVACSSDLECAALGGDFACREGQCRSSAQSVDACVGDGCSAQSTAELPELLVTPPSGDTAFKQLTLGLIHSCALRNDGRVYCWGFNGDGELGTPPALDSTDRGVALEVPSVREGVRLYAGGNTTCVSQQSGATSCWGEMLVEQDGEEGAYSSNSRVTPELIAIDAAIAELSLGVAFSCARLNGGDVHCWGLNHRGQLGDGTRVGRAQLGNPLAANTRVLRGARQLASDTEHSCAVDQAGAVYCWGSVFRESTSTSEDDMLSAVRVPITDAVKVDVGGVHACALRKGGRVSCWGSNSGGQLGDGSMQDSSTPVDVRGLSDAVDIALGGGRSCALKASGQVACWGYGMNGSLGTADQGSRSTPGLVVELDDAYAIDSGSGSTCALSQSRGILCWGYNGNQQLGDSTTETRARPVPVVFD
jgi:alpha-tubulin suppressor-like RCC1 family protein